MCQCQKNRLSLRQESLYLNCLRSCKRKASASTYRMNGSIAHARSTLMSPLPPISMAFDWPTGGAGYAVRVRLLSRRQCMLEDCTLAVPWDEDHHPGCGRMQKAVQLRLNCLLFGRGAESSDRKDTPVSSCGPRSRRSHPREGRGADSGEIWELCTGTIYAHAVRPVRRRTDTAGPSVGGALQKKYESDYDRKTYPIWKLPTWLNGHQCRSSPPE